MSRLPEVWFWSPSSIVGGPVDICQWFPVGGPDGAYSCSSVGGLTDTGSCPLPLGRRPSRGLSPPLGQRPGRVWFLPPTPLSGPPPLGPSLHQPPECLSHRPRRRLHDFCILELKLTFCSPNLGSCLSSFGFTFFPCERFWSNEVFIFFLVLNTLLCGHAEGD